MLLAVLSVDHVQMTFEKMSMWNPSQHVWQLHWRYGFRMVRVLRTASQSLSYLVNVSALYPFSACGLPSSPDSKSE